VVEGSAGTLNVLSDPFGNLVGKPLVTLGMAAHDALAPVFGYDRFSPDFRATMLNDTVPQPGSRIAEATGRAIGAPATEDIHPATPGEAIVRSVVPAAVGMAALGGGSGVLRNALVNPALGVSGALGGKLASALAPDWAQPAAELVGNVAGMVAPNTLVGLGGRVFVKPNPLLDDAGAPVISRATGQPLVTTPAQARAAGEQLTAAATDPAAVRATLDNPPAPLMEGDQPTTAKVTGDPGLNAAEFTASRTGTEQQKGAFIQQANRQNDARVRAIQSQAAEGDVPTADAALKAHAEAADQLQATRVAGVQTDAATDLAKAQAQGEKRVSGLAQTADTARSAIGGDLPPGSDAQVGAALRDPIATANQAAKAREGALWEAIDPGGKLAVDMGPVKTGAAAILQDMSPNAAPLAGNEAGIFSTAAALPDVQSFRDLAALRNRITDAIRQERGPQGDPQAVRRMSMLLGHVHRAMEESAISGADQTTVARLRSGIKTWDDETDAASAQTVPDRAGNTGQHEPGRAGAVPPLDGASDQAGSQREPARSGFAGRTGGLPPGSADEVAPLKGPNRQPQTLHDFVISRGGVKDQAGEYRSQEIDRIHHRAGGRLINNTSGVPEDYMREAAVQEGFLPANADVNDFRDAMLSTTPVYRISEAHEAAARRAERTQAWQTDEARYNSRDAVAVAADEAGARLSPAELDHATELHMRGVHPEEAVRQAASATESGALDRNAAANAVGSPGVPLAARQADNGLAGATRLQPNFDQAAADRYAAARQATADRAATFKNAPGVGQVLQGGPQAGSFQTPDSAVPNIIVKVGPAGADVAKAYLAAGGDPEALAEAAAFSLRRYAARPDGTLAPDKVGAWAKERASFLSQLPESADKFSAAADAQRAVEAGTKDAAAALKQATETAQTAVDNAMADRASAAKAMQASAIGRFLGQSDPVATMWSILNDKRNGQANARTLAQAVAGNPDAVAGLQRTVAAAIEREIVGNSRGATSEEGGIRAEKFQNLIKHGGPALREILTPEQMRGVMTAHDSLVRDYRSGQVGFGSATGQIQSGTAPGVVKQVAKTVLGMASGAGVGAAIGAWIGERIGVGASAGSFVGGNVGVAVSAVIQRAREAGIQNVADLRTEALLNPALYRLLTTKVTPQNRSSLLAGVAAQLGRASLVSTATGQQDRRTMPSPPQNALLH
jgi:hypothetical protein